MNRGALICQRKKNIEQTFRNTKLTTLVYCLLPEIWKFFDSEKGQKEFVERKAKQDCIRQEKRV